MAKLVVTLGLLLLPSMCQAWGYVFARPKRVVTAHAASTIKARKATCDTSYPTICVPAGAAHLQCSEIGYANFTVVGSDPHGFDSDRNGVGCETAPRH